MSVDNQTGAASKQGWKHGWRGQAIQFAAVVLAVFVAKGALAEPFYVPSGSMEPTLQIGDALLASKFAYGYSTASLPIQINLPETGRVFSDTPKRGDVVVFRWPGDRSQAWVKRVVGLPGDRIQMREGQLFINDHAASLKPDGIGEAEDGNGGAEPAYRYVETLPNGVSYTTCEKGMTELDNTREYIVPAGNYFMMGDDRDNSADSRVPSEVGFVPFDNLVGPAQFVVASFDSTTTLLQPWTLFSGFRGDRFMKRVR